MLGLSGSYLKSLETTLVLAVGEWKRTRMSELLWRGQKQKLEEVIIWVAGQLYQIPSLSSIIAFLEWSTRLKSTSMFILLTTLMKIQQEGYPSERQRGRLISRMFMNYTYFLRGIEADWLHSSSWETLSSKSTCFPLRLKAEKPKLKSWFLSNSNMKSLNLRAGRVQQLVTAGSSLCLEAEVEAIRVKCEKYFSFLTLTTDTVKPRPQISYYLKAMKPSLLCYTFSSCFSGSRVFETQSLRALRGATKLKETSFFCQSRNDRSILSSSSSISQLKVVPSVSSIKELFQTTVISNQVFSSPSTLISNQSSYLDQQTKGWWKLLVLSLHLSEGIQHLLFIAAQTSTLGEFMYSSQLFPFCIFFLRYTLSPILILCLAFLDRGRNSMSSNQY